MRASSTLISRGPARVRVGACEALLPWHPAGEWLSHLDHLSAIAARLAEPPIRELFVEQVLDHPQGAADLRDESFRILSEATGRKWWEAGRLMSTSLGSEVLGRLILAGVDPWQRSIGEWCAAVYALCVKGSDEKGRLKFDFSLSLPPAGYEDAWDDDGDDPAAIEAAMAGLFGTQ